ncbi:MAG: tandem-95 repeat protein [Rhodospirillaceae bacterium]|nr:tandem-95 repeat protein [Rhodospirillaceae bacterium]
MTDPANTAPVAGDDALAADEDTALVISIAGLLANDGDTDGDTLALAGFAQPAHGTLADNGDGTLTYTPDADYAGADSFTYTVTDGTATDTATVALTVAAANDAPTAGDDTATTAAGTPLVLSVAGLLANDGDADGDPLTLVGFTQPAHGTLVGEQPSVRLNFSAALDAMWSPEGPAGSVAVASNGTDAYLEIAVPAGDYDAWNANNTTRVVQDAVDEDFEVQAKFLTLPSQRFQMQGILVEQDAKTWIRFDVYHDGSKLYIFSAATANGWTAAKFNTSIAAANATYMQVTREGDVWTFRYSGDGQTWTTAGSYTFAMTVTGVGPYAGSTGSPGAGPGYTAQVDYFFNTAAPIADEDAGNAAPVAGDDTAATAADTALVLSVADLLANDSDADGDALSLAGFTQPAHGTLVDNGDGTLTYTPDAGYAGADSITYTVTDGTATASATVAITVTDPANTAPVAGDDALAATEDTALVISIAGLLANDGDADGDALALAGFAQPAHGTLADNGDGTLTYTPAPDFNGIDTFTYTVGDGRGGFSTAEVEIAVAAVNDAPAPGDDTATVDKDTALVLSIAGLLANDGDVDGDVLSWSGFTQPVHGALVDNGDGSLTYTPEAGFTGVDSFTYGVTDGAAEAWATVDISISPIIDVWYGTTQEFAHLGEAQRWVNILGNVDLDQVTGLTYSLNGGAEVVLSIGPDTRRLQDSGDFNIDLDYADLDGSSADDVVTITATLNDGSTVTQDVTIVYESNKEWAKNYTIDWSTVTDIQDVVQVVDGQWVITEDGIRTAAPGYDRVLALGDQTWDNYEVNLTLTIHTMGDGTVRDGAGLGVGMLWDGHTDSPIKGWQPLSGWDPFVSPFYSTQTGSFILHDYPNWAGPHLDESGFLFEEGASYNLKVRVEQTNVFDRVYSFKIWEAGTDEPADWLLYGVDTMTDPVNGAFVLIAHNWDVTFGDITVTEITGNDIIAGRDTDDLVIAVDESQSNPGLGEIDVLQGGAGADVFVFGNAAGDFYDDGNAATAGTQDYGLIWDFEQGIDRIQLAGGFDDYVIADTADGLPDGAGIYRASDGELIGIVNGVDAASLHADDFLDIWIA